ncbi:MAG: TetR/AcrR family transcriptional regulator [Archangium gephyra]|uniref:TetR/AcrR family transcriptional regulator n=1 Tax=Archangium gephyra TaxID=48 RepID=A0A2W5TUT4_9BACT|nr:MAG: TetR/AcrR family transcriptional regulator [Archangium gephyra]
MATRKKPVSRAQKTLATREDVLKAARDEFERVGFDAANLRTIAARAGVSAATVLHHTGDKRELLYASLFADLASTLSRAFVELNANGLEDELLEVAERVFAYYRHRPKLSRVLLKESLFAEGPWSSRFVGQVTGVHQKIAERVQRAVERGELRHGADAVMVATAWFSFFYFALIGWVQGSVSDPVELVGRLFQQHLDGLRTARSRA